MVNNVARYINCNQNHSKSLLMTPGDEIEKATIGRLVAQHIQPKNMKERV
jgi:hypothetical protein